MSNIGETVIKVHMSDNAFSNLFGNLDENILLIDKHYGIRSGISDGSFVLRGDKSKVTAAEALVKELIRLIESGSILDRSKVMQCIELVESGQASEVMSLERDVVAVTARGRQIKCKTVGQRRYVKAIKENTVVISAGPAGTGKTFLAVAVAAGMQKAGEVDKIILTRPAVEVGEKLGFLPGDLIQKVDPYLRPLYDALQEMYGIDNYVKLLEKGIIEIAPLAYMRGRTLSNAFIILDEAQNTTEEQMKMFLTRLGEGSRAVINGDTTQIDLPAGKRSGLIQACDILQNIEDIAIIQLSERDVVRHPLVKRIVQAYDDKAKR